MLMSCNFQLIVDFIAASNHLGLTSNRAFFLFRFNRATQRHHSIQTDDLDVMRDR
jgi:hypothetical protein